MGTTLEPKKLRKTFVNIISQNVRGFSDEKEEEIIDCMGKHKIWAACLQETWRITKASWENKGYTFLHNGLDVKPCARGAQGVAIVLGPDARIAWEKAGSQQLYFGTRIVATRLKLIDATNRSLVIYLVSAYAPDSSRPVGEHEEFEMHKQCCYNSVKVGEILVEGTDANASLGNRNRHDNREASDRDRVMGPFGIPYVNAAGEALLQMLGMNGLCAPTSYFRKKGYTTWRHPGRKSPFQLDYFFMKQRDLKRVRDAGCWNHGVDSDHCAILIRLEVAYSFSGPRAPRTKRVDRGMLQDPAVRQAWREAVSKNVEFLQGSVGRDGTQATALQVLEGAMTLAAKEVLMSDGRRRPGWFLAAREQLKPVIDIRNAATMSYFSNPLDTVKGNLKAARKNVKRAVRSAKDRWMESIIAHINGRESVDDRRPITPKECWDAIRELERGPRAVKDIAPLALRKDQGSDGAKDVCETPEENAKVMVASLMQTFSKKGTFDAAAVECVSLRKAKPWLDNPFTDHEISVAVQRMPNGKSAGEANCPAEYFKTLQEDPSTRKYLRDVVNGMWKTGSFPIGEIPSGPQPELAEATMELAIAKGWRISFRQANPKNPTTKSWARYKAYKGCGTTQAALLSGCKKADLTWDWKHGYVTVFDPASEQGFAELGPLADDSTGLRYSEWDVARLVLLPKKGDLSFCKNWRGICLLDVASKIFSSMLVRRMQVVMEEEGMDEQAGFRALRGIIDGLFATSVGLQKRKEHNLETWVLFVDLVKAFDTVPREALFAVLRRFGLPDHFVNVVIRLHENARIKVKVGDVESELESSIGVRQGSCEGPVLFLFIMQAAMETMEWPVPKPEFRTRADGVTMGERSGRKRGASTFEHWCSLFADDCALFFNSRSDLEIGASYLYNHLRKFGLQVHVGSGSTASKTEAMYIPPLHVDYSAADTSRFNIIDGAGLPVGFVDFTTEFKYLGSILHHSLTSDADVDKRIKSATAAFGALKNIFTNRHIDLKVKGRIYVALCLSILLYGCEVWCLRSDLLARLRRFHHRCARTMCRITIAHTIRHHISTDSLLKRLGVEPLDTYYHRRLLRWAGHVSRMPLTRAPRKLLTGWVEHPRPIGCPQMTWGRTLKKALKSVKLPTDFIQWRIAAADRDQWRVICGSKSRIQKETPNLSRRAIWDELRYGAAQPL